MKEGMLSDESCNLFVSDFPIEDRGNGVCGCGLHIRKHPRSKTGVVQKKVHFQRTRKITVTVWDTGVSKSCTINDDQIDVMTVNDFAQVVRDLFLDDELRLGYFSIYKVNISELDMINNKGRKWLRTDAELKEALDEIFSLSAFEASRPSIYIWSEKSPEEHKSPEIDPKKHNDNNKDGRSCDDSERSSVASKVCKMRDAYKCVFCRHDNSSQLAAAYLVEIETLNHFESESEKKTFTDKLGLLTANDIWNLLTLCNRCPFYFDKKGGYRLRINPSNKTLEVHDSIRSKISLAGTTYGELDGGLVVFSSNIQHMPSKTLLEYRMTFGRWTEEEDQQLTQMYKNLENSSNTEKNKIMSVSKSMNKMFPCHRTSKEIATRLEQLDVKPPVAQKRARTTTATKQSRSSRRPSSPEMNDSRASLPAQKEDDEAYEVPPKRRRKKI